MIADLIIGEAQTQGVDPSLALEVATAESGLNQSARGSSGEIGVFQLMPGTAAELGVDPNDLQQNIHGGVRYLAQKLAEFGDPMMAVAAYNAGSSAVQSAVAEFGTSGYVSAAPGAPSVPAWLAGLTAGTRNYVARIFANLPQYAASIPGVSPTSTLPPDNQPGYVAPGLMPGNPAMYMVFAAISLMALWVYANAGD